MATMPDLTPPLSQTSEAPPFPVADELALQRLASRYWALADGTEEFAIAELFTSDGVLELGSLRLEGVEAIQRFFVERERANKTAGRVTRHLASGLLVVPLSSESVRVRSTVIVHAGNGDLPIEVSLPSGIADFEDVCVRSDNGAWLYRSRIGRTVFVGPSAASFAR
jgi:hypothetical protein